jgi:hypothetical protein
MNQFWAFVGSLVAPGWEGIETVKEFVELLALCMVSLGSNLHSMSSDETQANVVLGGWPSRDSLETLGLAQKEADTFWGVIGPIAESRSFGCEWNRQGDVVNITISS